MQSERKQNFSTKIAKKLETARASLCRSNSNH